MTEHDLKTLPVYFQAVIDGIKSFELRKNDRDYKVGDRLLLREYDPQTGYSGRQAWGTVSYILYGGSFGLPDNMCVMSMVMMWDNL